MTPLSTPEIVMRMQGATDWAFQGDEIKRTYEFSEFMRGVRFVAEVAKIAEEKKHHPDIDIRYRKVRLALTTHDSGGLTDKDFEVAKECDKLFEKLSV